MAAERQRPNLDSCRLCLAEGPDQIKIFSDRGLQLKIAETINKLFPFKVERNDGFPHNACYKCLHKLILYENLRRTFQWSTSVLDGYRNVRPVPGILTEDDSDDSGVEDGNVAGGSDLHDNLDSSTDRLPSSSTNNNDNDVGCSTGNQPSTSVQNNDVQKPDCQPSTSVQNNDVPNAGCQASSTTNTIDVDNQVETDNSNRHKSLTVTKGDTRSSASLDMPGSLQSSESVEGEVSSAQELNTSDTESKNIVEKNKQRTTTTKKTQCVCYKCHEQFETKALLMLHYCNTQFSSHISCRYCHSQFSDMSSLAAHKKKHLEEPVVSRKKYGDVFESHKALKNHAKFECCAKTRPVRSSKSSFSSSQACCCGCSTCDGGCNSFSRKKRQSSPKKCVTNETKQNNKPKGRTNAKPVQRKDKA